MLLYLYFLGTSTRCVAKALLFLLNIRRSNVAIWKRLQKCQHRKPSLRRRTIEEFIVDETLLKVGPELIWLWWITGEPENSSIPLTNYNPRNKHVCC